MGVPEDGAAGLLMMGVFCGARSRRKKCELAVGSLESLDPSLIDVGISTTLD